MQQQQHLLLSEYNTLHLHHMGKANVPPYTYTHCFDLWCQFDLMMIITLCNEVTHTFTYTLAVSL